MTISMQFNLINLSLSYDGFTVYRNFPIWERVLESRLNPETQKYEEWWVVTEPKKITSHQENFDNFLDEIDKQWDQLDEQVDDPKIDRGSDMSHHELYHADSFPRSQDHIHYKFKSMLSSAEIEKLLDLLVTNTLLTQDDKNSFLKAIEAQQENTRELINNQIELHRNNPEKPLRETLSKVTDNRMLIDVHTFLSQPKYDYLRIINQNDKKYYTINAKGDVVETSKTWAQIEKTIAMQMLFNIRNASALKLTPQKKGQLTVQLAKTHHFFAIKRKKPKRAVSNMVLSFCNEDDAQFVKRYKKNNGQ